MRRHLIVSENVSFAVDISTPTGGDGYIPVVYTMTTGASAGETRIFAIFHHNPNDTIPSPAPIIYYINCVIRSTGAICPGYPKQFSSNVSGSPPNVYTAFTPHNALIGSKLYYTAQRANDNGVGCFDLETGLNCGYVQLGSLPKGTSFGSPSNVDGLEQIGTKLYSFGYDGKAYCYDTATQNGCVGQPYTATSDSTNRQPLPREVINGKIYFVINHYGQGADAKMYCFDPATNASCAGWATKSIVGTSNIKVQSIFEYKTTTGAPLGVCTGVRPLATPVQCWNVSSGASMAPPPNFLNNVPTTDQANNFFEEYERPGTNKTYFALWYPNSTGQQRGLALCYDFPAQNQCSGFRAPNNDPFWPTVNGGWTSDYGYAEYNGCFFGTGDIGWLWGFDPLTGLVGGSCDFTPPSPSPTPTPTPIIRVIKSATVQSICQAGSTVNYSYAVTNPGTLPLSNITISDDKCGPPINFTGGDTNADNILQNGETWRYTCTTIASAERRITNTATVTGTSGAQTVSDTDSVTITTDCLEPIPLTCIPEEQTIEYAYPPNPVYFKTKGGSINSPSYNRDFVGLFNFDRRRHCIRNGY